MAKAVYIGALDISHNGKKMYFGDENSTARKIKKGYLGVNGVARLFYTSGTKLVYQGSSNDGIPVLNGAGISFGNYALFAGGQTKSTSYPFTVKHSAGAYAFDRNITKQSITNLKTARTNLIGGCVGKYALFCGGYDDSSSSKGLKNVDVYDEDLTRSNTEMKYVRGASTNGSPKCATIGNHLLITDGTASTTNFDAFDDELTLTNPVTDSLTRYTMAAASNAKYALFIGGKNTSGTPVANVVAFDNDLTRTTSTTLSVRRYDSGAACAGDHVVVAGGFGGNGNGFARVTAVDAYDNNLTRTTPTPISHARYTIPSTSLQEHALFPNGDHLGTDYTHSNVDAYDDELTQTIVTNATPWRRSHMVAAVGDYALAVGGQGVTSTGSNQSKYLSTIEIFKAESV